MSTWLERRPAFAALFAGIATAAALPPLYLLPGLAGFGVLLARPAAWPARTRQSLPPRHGVRFRVLSCGPLLGGNCLLRRRRAIRHLRRAGGAGAVPVPCPHRRPCRSHRRAAAVAISDGAGTGLRGRLDLGRAIARCARAAISLESDRSSLGRDRPDDAGNRLHRHLRTQPVDRGCGFTHGALVPCWS